MIDKRKFMFLFICVLIYMVSIPIIVGPVEGPVALLEIGICIGVLLAMIGFARYVEFGTTGVEN